MQNDVLVVVSLDVIQSNDTGIVRRVIVGSNRTRDSIERLDELIVEVRLQHILKRFVVTVLRKP